MPSKIQSIAICLLVVSSAFQDAQAGPLIDWLLGRPRQPAVPVGPPVAVGGNGYAAGYGPAYAAGYRANYGTYYGSQLPVQNGVAAATLPPTVSYLPNYASRANRVPVTYYRPVLTTDPTTGTQVVSMAPCTSYEVQTQRVPVGGRSMLFGSASAPPVVPPTPALPNYTLPSQGVPLASNALGSTLRGGAPAPMSVYSNAFPSSTVGNYPTNPYGAAYSPTYSSTWPGTTTYYGAPLGLQVPSGGCSGSWVPGLTAPAAPTTSYPGTVTGPAQGLAPTGQGSLAPTQPSNSPVLPSQGLPSQDPRASETPSLSPQASLSPRLQSITRQPVQSTSRPKFPAVNSMGANSLNSEVANEGQEAPAFPSTLNPIENRTRPSSVPVLEPIPLSEDEPSYKPGLLRDSDLTASRAAQLAGQAKRIRWASFESSSARGENYSLSLDDQETRPSSKTAPNIGQPGPEAASRKIQANTRLSATQKQNRRSSIQWNRANQ